jgi:hypothetical protein
MSAKKVKTVLEMIPVGSLVAVASGGDRGSPVIHECARVRDYNSKHGVYLVELIPSARWRFADRESLHNVGETANV